MIDVKSMEPSFDECFKDDPRAVIEYVQKLINDVCENETTQKLVVSTVIEDISEQAGTFLAVLETLKMMTRK